MKMKIALVTIAIGLFSLVIWATPASGIIFNIILSTGTVSEDLDEKVNIDGWKVDLSTKGSTDFYMQDLAIAPGGYTGWHTHSGIFVGTVITGSLDFYDENCNLTTYTAGQVWTENDKLHAVANHGTVDLRSQFVYLVKQGQPRRIDQPAPACAPITGIP
jgi:quercetin dioxygenase-like cupin family protein